MNINTFLDENNIRVIALEGRLDTLTSPLLRDEVALLPDDTGSIVFDLKELEYISSAGLRELMVCRKRFRNSDMKVVNVSSEVADIFETTGFDQLLDIETAETEVRSETAIFSEKFENLSLAGFIKKRTETAPDDVVCITPDGSLTWKDLDTASSFVASELEGIGVNRKSRVGLCGRNSINWIITFYAIQKLGAMALLINPNLRPEEVAGIASVSDMTHLCYGEMTTMTDEDEYISGIKAVEDCPVTQFYSIRNSRDLTKEAAANKDLIREPVLSRMPEADDPCIMIFTSGSTGKPKGVILSSYNVLNAAASNAIDQTLKSTDKTCLILPLFHVFGLIAGLFANAAAGSPIVIPPDIRTGTLLKIIEEEKCTHFHSVPTMLLAIINNRDFKPELVSSVRCTIISGAAATESQIKLFKEKFPGDHFMTSYGLSEMAPVSLTDYEDTDEHVLNTVGHPVRNIKVRIWDNAAGAECPAGEKGEIQVQGYNLMAGYYKVSIDEQSIDGEGWLHTGDLGYLNEDGYITFSGRIKELIIRGGENVMPREVESAVSRFDAVEDVKVIGIPNEFFGEEVCACIKIKDGMSFDADAAKTELESMIAKYKIPSVYMIFDEFPRLANGKIDVITLKQETVSALCGQIHAASFFRSGAVFRRVRQ